MQHNKWSPVTVKNIKLVKQRREVRNLKLKHHDISKNIDNQCVKTELRPIEMILVPDDGVQNFRRPV